MMHILGLSCYFHDAAAALLRDGVLIAAAEEERFSRTKHDFGFPRHAIDFCLRQGGLTAQDLDYVVFYEKPFVKFQRILQSNLRTWPRSWRAFPDAMTHWMREKLWTRTLIQETLGIPAERILFSEHHLSHAASAFFCAPYEEAAIITVDGVGEWTTTTMGRGSATWNGQGRNEIVLSHEIRFPHSLGLLYSAFTAFLGFEVNEGEYKVMGMAPYGQPRYRDRVAQVLHLERDGSFWLDLDYLSYHYSDRRSFSRKLTQLFGEPRVPESEFYTRSTGLPDRHDARRLEANEHYADVAASIQQATEDALLAMANRVHDETGLTRLCLAGGVAYNSVANGRLLRETPFTDIYIQPAAGDSGGAVGAALYAYHVLLQRPRAFVMDHAYWGAAFSDAQLEAALRDRNLAFERFSDDEELLEEVAGALADGRVVGWYQGRTEWGPRALGNRSILADPRRAEMKSIVNEKIKFREPFRPFAPSILMDRVAEYVDFQDSDRHLPAQFMLYVADVRPEQRSRIPAVTHADGSSRLQAVSPRTNPRYARLIERFEARTGVPVVLNTSFNLRGEPMVNAPADAVTTFLNSGIDWLALGSYLVRKPGSVRADAPAQAAAAT
ncbi:MAG: carbamoyltransferase [Candidatus Omnitrophica bacterium]|nr:carbamoyltransferase [Candidatus Omnitrophota bacterium]